MGVVTSSSIIPFCIWWLAKIPGNIPRVNVGKAQACHLPLQLRSGAGGAQSKGVPRAAGSQPLYSLLITLGSP